MARDFASVFLLCSALFHFVSGAHTRQVGSGSGSGGIRGPGSRLKGLKWLGGLRGACCVLRAGRVSFWDWLIGVTSCGISLHGACRKRGGLARAEPPFHRPKVSSSKFQVGKTVDSLKLTGGGACGCLLRVLTRPGVRNVTGSPVCGR